MSPKRYPSWQVIIAFVLIISACSLCSVIGAAVYWMRQTPEAQAVSTAEASTDPGGTSEPSTEAPAYTATASATEPVATLDETATTTPTASATPIPPTPTRPAAPEIRTVTVPAEIVWFDTGIQIQAGQRLIFSAMGSTNQWGGTPEATSHDPNGQRYICQSSIHPDCLMNEVPYGKLIGKIGNNEPFEVGTYLETLASAGGRLYLAVNDHYQPDNFGVYNVTITSYPYKGDGEAVSLTEDVSAETHTPPTPLKTSVNGCGSGLSSFKLWESPLPCSLAASQDKWYYFDSGQDQEATIIAFMHNAETVDLFLYNGNDLPVWPPNPVPNNMGAGTEEGNRDGDPNTREFVWRGPITPNTRYYVRFVNRGNKPLRFCFVSRPDGICKP